MRIAVIAAFWIAAPRGYAQAESTCWFHILVPDNLVPAGIGRAVLRQGNDDILVLAAGLPVQQFALRQITGLARASVSHLPGATVLRIPRPVGQKLEVTASKTALCVNVGTAPAADTIDPSFDKGTIRFPTGAAGPVVTLSDPRSGRPLLIGTVTGPVALGQSLSGPGYRLNPTPRGIAVLALSDELVLTSGSDGFTLRAKNPSPVLPVGNPPVTAPLVAVPDTPGGLNLPHGSITTLRTQMEADLRRVANAPPLDRRHAMLRLARVMLSLDMAQEARGVLDDLIRIDPTALNDPQRHALLMVADVLAGNRRAAARDWPAVPTGATEFKLWTGLADAEAGDRPRAAAELARQIQPLAALPVLIRRQVVPLALEVLIAHGNLHAAKALFAALPNQRGLDLEHAELLEKSGDKRAALAAYHALFDARNNRVAGIARTRAIMLRYELHKIDDKAAAAKLSRHVFDWRGRRHELRVRFKIAELQASAGRWLRALAGLDHALALFPDQTKVIDKNRHEIFDRLVGSNALKKMAPLEVTALIQNNTDLIPPGAPGVPVLKLLSRQLLALGLTNPAAEIMRELIDRAPDPQSRAQLGLDLARLELRARAFPAAQKALDITRSDGLSSDLAASRTVVEAEIASQEGHPITPNLAIVAGHSGAEESLARLAAKRGDWTTAERIWRQAARLRLPATGMLDSAQARIVTAWATAAANANDRPTVARLHGLYRGRLPPGPDATLFDTITAEPLSSDASLASALHQIDAIEALAKGTGHSSQPKNR